MSIIPTPDEIVAFVKKPDIVQEAYALMIVARKRGDSPEDIMQKVLADAIAKFHGIPLKVGSS